MQVGMSTGKNSTKICFHRTNFDCFVRSLKFPIEQRGSQGVRVTLRWTEMSKSSWSYQSGIEWWLRSEDDYHRQTNEDASIHFSYDASTTLEQRFRDWRWNTDSILNVQESDLKAPEITLRVVASYKSSQDRKPDVQATTFAATWERLCLAIRDVNLASISTPAVISLIRY